MPIEADRSLNSLRLALDTMVAKATREMVEHERRAAEAKRRCHHLSNLRACLDRPPATGRRP
jgi:hypothetical protein